MTTDYGKTIHLPKTDFPRRAGLAQKEPEILARWEEMRLYDRQREAGKGREKFILHMGPPFANGHIHLGHVLSTVLKDVVCRSYRMLGYDAPLVPGFDCHGLPIEWKIEEQYRAEKKNLDKDTHAAEFRAACRDFAGGWVKVQSEEFRRIGISADFANPYLTMDKKSEALIAAEVHKFLRSGALSRGSKPVMWSVAEKTALAEAEVEYRDMTSDTVWVKFPVKSGPKALEGAAVVIWTTTPWSLPGNRALAYGEDIAYAVIEVQETEEDSLAKVGEKLVVSAHTLQSPESADAAVKNIMTWSCKDLKIRKARRLTIDGAEISGTICRHPLHGQGYDFDVPLLPGDFVTTDAGTGFVHVAPGHGEDDYRLGLKHGIAAPQTVEADGTYSAGVPLFAGAPVYFPDGKKGPAGKLVMQALMEAGNLAAKSQVRHSYPHSWRSKAPVIFRNTPQWFISMDRNGLREKALAEIKKTRWVPPRGENRIAAMVEQRGDWCVSRQRAWGVPIAVFVDKKTGEVLADENVLSRTVALFLEEGSDAWFTRPAADFLGEKYDPEDYEQVKDIVDVWFESGATQGFVLEERAELRRPADLYLEGSDQHRGWFQSSLLVGCATRGDAPFRNVLTHGFILDEKGFKMSKSQGNATSPLALTEAYGADVLRLWVAGSDYTEDIKFGENILKAHAETYRRIRGTFCYLLGSIDDGARVAEKDLPALDRYMLHRLWETDALVRKCIADFDFQRMMTALHNFCARDLSAFYFDICKDTLYCDAADSEKRRGVVTVLDRIFLHLIHWISPFLCFTAEEAWLSYGRGGAESIHLSSMPGAPESWRDDALAAQFGKIVSARAAVTGALELRRAAKDIGASLEAAPRVHVADTALAALLRSVPFSDICITSGIEIVTEAAPAEAFTLDAAPGVAVVFARAPGEKCERCWKYDTQAGKDPVHPTLCPRCAEAVRQQEKAAA